LIKRYGIANVEENVDINLSDASNLKSSSLSNGKGMCISFKDTSINVYAIQLDKNSKKFAIYKSVKADNGKTYTSFEGQITNTVDSIGNGYVELLKNGESNRLYFKNKKLVKNNKSYGLFKLAMAGWCQQEGSEGFEECFERESEEFCDDFVSTVAYYTNVSVPVLIATACLC